MRWAEALPAEKYGEPGCWLPWTHQEARNFLAAFLSERFHLFGAYEDAISTRGVRLFHSTLSPLMNVGLLTPAQVLDEALNHAANHEVPFPSLEGFVRQVLGWREFIRAAYEVDHVAIRSRNFWNHRRPLPGSFWAGKTGWEPVDHVIRKVRRTGYAHHIERLMVMGNIMLLSEIEPDQVYRWFMAYHLDAYDWVMVPNVYGMSQFADGGLFATKPYVSGANYLRKMSDFPGGAWEETWTALYWRFIGTNLDFFEKNPRLSMMPRMWKSMPAAKKRIHGRLAKSYFREMFPAR